MNVQTGVEKAVGDRMTVFGRGCFIAGIVALLVGAASASAQSLPTAARREFQDLLRADAILRGAILSVKADYVPAGEVAPQWPGKGYMELSVVTLDVREVIWGGISRGSPFTFLVEMGNSGLRVNYAVGQEVIVGLRYRSQFQGGTYFGGSRESLFILEDAEWVRQGHVTNRTFSLDEIRAILSPYRFEVIAESADIVVVGVVTRAHEGRVTNPSDGGTGRVWTVGIALDEVLKGNVVPDTLTFEMFGGGYYWPRWAEVTPGRIEEGTRYCAFVKRIENQLYSAGGVNGFFKVEGNRLVRNELPLPATLDSLRTLVENE